VGDEVAQDVFVCVARPGSADTGLAGPLTEVDLPCRRSEWHGWFWSI